MKLSKIVATLTATLLSAASLFSCSSQGAKDNPEEQVKQFAQKIGTWAQSNQLDSLRTVYPDAAQADSLAVEFTPETITVTPSKDGKSFEIKYANGVTLELKADENGNFTVTGSKGMFAYPKETLEIAKKTGQYDPNLPDAENGKRMRDTAFQEYLLQQFNKEITSMVKAGTKEVQGEFAPILQGYVKNDMTVPLEGSDYSLSYAEIETNWHENVYRVNMGEEPLPDKRHQHSKSGKTIQPNSSVTLYTWEYAGGSADMDGGPDTNSFTVKWLITPQQRFDKYYQPKGTEYNDYLQQPQTK